MFWLYGQFKFTVVKQLPHSCLDSNSLWPQKTTWHTCNHLLTMTSYWGFDISSYGFLGYEGYWAESNILTQIVIPTNMPMYPPTVHCHFCIKDSKKLWSLQKGFWMYDISSVVFLGHEGYCGKSNTITQFEIHKKSCWICDTSSHCLHCGWQTKWDGILN